MLLTKEVEYKVNGRSLQYYRDKGYQCNVGDLILVKIEDIKKFSSCEIEYECDRCKKIVKQQFRYFSAHRGIYDRTYCVKCANEIRVEKDNEGKSEYFAHNSVKKCTVCQRLLSADTDHFFQRKDLKDGFDHKCKECHGFEFTDYLTNIPREGYIFCKKCKRELPHTYYYFPSDKTCKTGLRNVCRECDSSYGNFLSENHVPVEHWTDDERNRLQALYPHYTNRELKEKFFPNRSIRSLTSQADIYGFSGKSDAVKEKIAKEKGELLRQLSIGRIMSDETKEKLSNSLKEYYKTHDGWWKGKKRPIEQCKQISERNTKYGRWKGENNPRFINPLSGSDNGNWKGGITNLYQELRSDTKEWMQQSMEFCNYNCVITGLNFHNIHHTTSFKDIVEETFKISGLDKFQIVADYSEEEFDCLTLILKQLHTEYGYGACINEKVHILFHNIYGYKNFTAIDFLDFVHRIDTGEFDDWFENQSLNIDINYNYMEYLKNTLSLLS